jgi:hypothetical protein
MPKYRAEWMVQLHSGVTGRISGLKQTPDNTYWYEIEKKWYAEHEIKQKL